MVLPYILHKVDTLALTIERTDEFIADDTRLAYSVLLWLFAIFYSSNLYH